MPAHLSPQRKRQSVIAALPDGQVACQHDWLEHAARIMGPVRQGSESYGKGGEVLE